MEQRAVPESLHGAIATGDPAVVSAFLSGKNAASILNLPRAGGETPLGFSVEWPKVLRLLVGLGALPDHAPMRTPWLTPLYVAAERNRAESISLLLAAGASTEVKDDAGRTPLALAAQLGFLESVQALIAGKADLNGARSLGGPAPLILAVQHKQVDVAKALIDAGADPDVNAADGRPCLFIAASLDVAPVVACMLNAKANPACYSGEMTPLFPAIAQGNAAIVAMLLRARPSLCQLGSDAKGHSPLHAAVARGLPEAVRLLIEAGAPLNPVDKTHRTPAHLAAALNCTAALTMLINAKAPLEEEDGAGCTPLLLAAQNGCLEAAKLLIAGGARLNHRSAQGNSALLLAIGGGHLLVAGALIAGGAQVDLATEDGRTPLHVAAAEGSDEVVRALVAADANCMRRTKQGDNVLHIAAADDRVGVIRAVQDAAKSAFRCLLDEPNGQGLTPLLAALCRGHALSTQALLAGGARQEVAGLEPALLIATQLKRPDLVKILLDAGANVDATNAQGNTALVLAVSSGILSVVEMLLKAKANVNAGRGRALIAAVQREDHAAVGMLLRKGANLDLADDTGYTALHRATACRSIEMVELLLRANASRDVRANTGATPLFVATQLGCMDIMRSLLRGGASVDLADDRGRTPLFVAAQLGHTEAVRVLLAKGANASARMASGWSCLHIAASAGKAEIVAHLLAHRADPNTLTDDGRAPLHVTSNADIVMALLAAGADPRAESPWGQACRLIADSTALALLDVAMEGKKKLS